MNFFIRDLPDVKISPFLSFPLQFWTFQNFCPYISATFSLIFWTEREKIPFEKKLRKKFTSGCEKNTGRHENGPGDHTASVTYQGEALNDCEMPA